MLYIYAIIVYHYMSYQRKSSAKLQKKRFHCIYTGLRLLMKSKMHHCPGIYVLRNKKFLIGILERISYTCVSVSGLCVLMSDESKRPANIWNRKKRLEAHPAHLQCSRFQGSLLWLFRWGPCVWSPYHPVRSSAAWDSGPSSVGCHAAMVCKMSGTDSVWWHLDDILHGNAPSTCFSIWAFKHLPYTCLT